MRSRPKAGPGPIEDFGGVFRDFDNDGPTGNGVRYGAVRVVRLATNCAMTRFVPAWSKEIVR